MTDPTDKLCDKGRKLYHMYEQCFEDEVELPEEIAETWSNWMDHKLTCPQCSGGKDERK